MAAYSLESHKTFNQGLFHAGDCVFAALWTFVAFRVRFTKDVEDDVAAGGAKAGVFFAGFDIL